MQFREEFREDGALIIVSNRIPLSARAREGDVVLDRSIGGLATGLSSVHEDSDEIWIGWPGDLPRLTRAQRESLDSQLAARRIHLLAIGDDETDENIFAAAPTNGLTIRVGHGDT